MSAWLWGEVLPPAYPRDGFRLRTPRRGIDLIAHTDPLGTTGPRIKVQVKRRDTEKVSAESLRAFMAVLGDQDVGIYISAAGFSSQAEREARSQEKRRLKLIDLERFVELCVQPGAPTPAEPIRA